MPLVANRLRHSQPSGVDGPRTAPWLKSPYPAPEWDVADSHGGAESVTLSFRMRMPDGRCFTEWSDFYAAVKEYAFLLRDPRYARVDDAEVHVASVRALMAVCHGLALDGFTSFKHANSKVFKRILSRMVQGNDGIWKASERLERWLANRSRSNAPGLKAGLPLRSKTDGSGYLKHLDNEKLMQLAGLPSSACKLPRVAHLCNAASREAGLHHRAEAGLMPDHVRLSVQALQRILGAIELLYVMRRGINGTSLPERPFSSASQVAKKHGSSTKPTPIPPAAPTLHLISHAMLWVSNYAPPLLELIRSALEMSDRNRAKRHTREAAFAKLVNATPSEGPEGSPWPLAERAVRVESARLSCQAAVRLLFAACFIVVVTFSARRKDAVLALEAADLDGSDEEGWWLRPYIQKTLQRKDWIPVPPIVSRAIDVLRALSEAARTQTETSSLFQWLNPFPTTPEVNTNLLEANGSIDEFASWVKTPRWSPKAGQELEWHWTPHQFRKFFAVLYFYRYKGATIEVLAHFLRHFNLEMTKQYLTMDKEAKSIFDSVEWGYKKHVARNIALKGGAALGGMTKRLAKQLIEHLRSKLRITAAPLEAPEEYILRQMERQRLVITPKAWVDCSCPRTKKAARSANCRNREGADSNELGPDFKHAGPEVCSECPFAIDNGRLEEALAEVAMNAKRTSVDVLTSGTFLHELAKERVVQLHRYVRADEEVAHG